MLLVLGFPSGPPAPRVCVCSHPSPHLRCEMAVRAAALAQARRAELLGAPALTSHHPTSCSGPAKNKRGLHCLRQETAGLPALSRRQHGKPTTYLPVHRPRALCTSPACSLEQVWIVPTVTGGFRASVGGFFQRVIASSARICPLRHHYLFFFGRTAYATPSEDRRDGLNCRR